MTSTSRYAGRSTRRYRGLRQQFRTDCQQHQLPCWLCGRPIDYTLPAGHPDAFNLDHAIPVSRRKDLAEDPQGFRASHAACNQRRGNDDPFIMIGTPSEHW
jgi:5-methylcytosine-specific restriction endonuclease McrA